MKKYLILAIAFSILLGNAFSSDSASKGYIKIKEADVLWAYGESKYKVGPGDVLIIEETKVCRGGSEICWKVRNIKT